MVALLDFHQLGTLFVEQINRRFCARCKADYRTLALGRFVLDQAERRETCARRGAHQSGAVAMRAFARRRLEHAGAQSLPAHFHQAEAGNAADLDARTIVLERFLHRLLDLARVGVVLLVDEVDHHETGHVAQAQLAGDLARGFEIGVQRSLLDIVLLGGAPRVNIDRDQRLGRVDHQIAARFELDHGIVHRLELVFRAIALEQRHRVRILLNPPRVAGHQQLHELLGRLVAVLALDHDFLDLAIVDVADRALDEIAIRMDQCGRARRQRAFADFVPQAGKIIEIALDLGFGARKARRAHDEAHGPRQAEVADDLLETLAVRGAGNLARDAAAVARIGHQHGVAPGEAEIGGQRGALVAALFLDDLNQQYLSALDDVLDLVAATQGHALGARFVDFLGPRAALALAAATTALAPATTARFLVAVAVFGVVVGIVVVIVVAIELAFLDRGDIVLVGRVDFLEAIFGEILGQRLRTLVVRIVFVAGHFAAVFFLVAQPRFFLGGFGFRLEQRFAVFLGNLVIVGMDLAEGEETVPIAAEVYEGRLQRRFDAGYFSEIDIALDLLVIGRFEIEFLNPVALEHRHPGFFLVARID